MRTGNIETPVVVGHGFKLTSGRVEVTVPDVITRNDYSLVCEYPRFLDIVSVIVANLLLVFGDSGNFGPTFTIKGVIDL